VEPDVTLLNTHTVLPPFDKVAGIQVFSTFVHVVRLPGFVNPPFPLKSMMREAVRCSLPPSPPERQPESMTAATTVTVTTSHARLPDFISLA
jgi:hypothetical protein